MTQAQISTLHPPEPIKMIMKAFLNIFCNSGQRTNEVRSKVQPYPPQISFINCFCTTVPIWLGWINSRGIISKRQTDWSMRDRSVSKIVQKHRGEGYYWFSQFWTKDRNWKKKHSRSELGCWQKWMDEVYKPVNAIRQELVLCLLSLIRPAGCCYLFDVSVQHGQQIFQTAKVQLPHDCVCRSVSKQEKSHFIGLIK